MANKLTQRKTCFKFVSSSTANLWSDPGLSLYPKINLEYALRASEPSGVSRWKATVEPCSVTDGLFLLGQDEAVGVVMQIGPGQLRQWLAGEKGNSDRRKLQTDADF